MTPTSEPEPGSSSGERGAMLPDAGAGLAYGTDAMSGPAADPVFAPPVVPASLIPAQPTTPVEGPPPEPTPSIPRRRRPRPKLRLLAALTLIVVGIGGLGWGGFSAAKELTRKASKAEVAAALAKELATRWQRLPAGTIFPATVTYYNSNNDRTVAALVGIAPRISCKDAVGPSTAQRIDELGCSTMLRATYVSASGTLAATVAIGVMPTPAAAENAWRHLHPMIVSQGLRTVAFRGTITSDFGVAQRGAAGFENDGTYIYLYTAGYTLGIPGAVARVSPELAQMGSGILTVLETNMAAHGKPCSMRDITC